MLLACVASHAAAATAQALLAPKHVILLYADDVGFADLQCYREWSAKHYRQAVQQGVATPNLDKLAASGILFSDAHSSAATCTPSRYSLMSGEYPFRKKGSGVLDGDAALLLDPLRVSLPQVFKQAGYRTGLFGKWHLGLGSGVIDWNKQVSPGPGQVGFDESLIIAATGDRVPCVLLENGKVRGLSPGDKLQVNYRTAFSGEANGREHPGLRRMLPSQGHNDSIVNGIPRIGFMRGTTSALWKDEALDDDIGAAALQFIRRNAGGKFFMMLSTHAIHVPRVPAPRWLGKSGFGRRGDMLLQLDETLGKLVNCLKQQGIYEQTMLVFSSDNGPMIDDGYREDSLQLCRELSPSHPWRAGKYSLFEGGTRVPMLLAWPQQVKPGVSPALVCQMDFLASFAHALQVPLPARQARDSINLWPALLDHEKPGRGSLVLTHGAQRALRMANWKYIAPRQQVRSGWLRADRPEAVFSGEQGLLYDLNRDAAEQRECGDEQPQQRRIMQQVLREALL